MESLKVDRSKLITKSEYARELGITPAGVAKMILAGKLKTVKIKGGELILLS